MKATQVTYSRLYNTGNYENMKIEIQLEVAEGEKATDVLTKARQWVEHHGPKKERNDYDYKMAKERLETMRKDLTLNQIEKYEKLIAEYEAVDSITFDF